MANYCNFSIKLTSPNVIDILDFFKACTVHYEGIDTDPEHFYRVFECDLGSFNNFGYAYEAILIGYCAWSIRACFRHDGYHKSANLPNGTCLESFCKKHPELIVEFISEEPGMTFSEHLLVKNETVLIDNCCDFYELDYGTGLDSFNNLTGLNWSQQEYDNYYSKHDQYIYFEREPVFSNHRNYL